MPFLLNGDLTTSCKYPRHRVRQRARMRRAYTCTFTGRIRVSACACACARARRSRCAFARVPTCPHPRARARALQRAHAAIHEAQPESLSNHSERGPLSRRQQHVSTREWHGTRGCTHLGGEVLARVTVGTRDLVVLLAEARQERLICGTDGGRLILLADALRRHRHWLSTARARGATCARCAGGQRGR